MIKKNIKKTSGFTLIELIIVIIILGVLSATAIPKFVDFRSDAVIASTKNLYGVINSTVTLVYAKSVIEGLENRPSGQIIIGNSVVDLVYGYPAATKAGISTVLEFDEGDWKYNERDNDWHSRPSVYPGAWIYWHGSIDRDAGDEKCYLRYRESQGVTLRPTIDFESRDC